MMIGATFVFILCLSQGLALTQSQYDTLSQELDQLFQINQTIFPTALRLGRLYYSHQIYENHNITV